MGFTSGATQNNFLTKQFIKDFYMQFLTLFQLVVVSNLNISTRVFFPLALCLSDKSFSRISNRIYTALILDGDNSSVRGDEVVV